MELSNDLPRNRKILFDFKHFEILFIWKKKQMNYTLLPTFLFTGRLQLRYIEAWIVTQLGPVKNVSGFQEKY